MRSLREGVQIKNECPRSEPQSILVGRGDRARGDWEKKHPGICKENQENVLSWGKQRKELRGKEATSRVKCCWEVRQNEARELALRVSGVGTVVALPRFRQHVGVQGAKAGWEGSGSEHKPALQRGAEEEPRRTVGSRETLNVR